MNKNSKKYFDRDLSWLSFNYRVLDEARDAELPIFERVKFLAIYSSNLDEFFRVRVANLRSLAELDKKKIHEKLHLKPRKLHKKIHAIVNKQLKEFGEIFRTNLLPELKKNGIILYQDELVLKPHKKIIDHYFKSRILAFLKPVFIESSKESYFLENKQLYLVLKLRENFDEEKIVYSYLNIPSNHIDRYLSLPEVKNFFYFITIDDVIRANLDFIYPDHTILGCYSIKLNRDADLNIDDEYSGDLVKKIKKQLSKREIGAPSRFLYDLDMPDDMLKVLSDTFDINEDDLVPGGRYHNFNDLFSLKNPNGPELENKPLNPITIKKLEESKSLFEAINQKDYMLHFPYQSYDYILRFFNEAAIDPRVYAIMVTFYRVAQDSFIVNALISAARNGKKVTVFIEVKARFDEANNLYWAEKMEESGITIIYSIPGLKVHAKVALVKRRNSKGEKMSYAFLGTGNFNEKTAGIYADHGLLTSHPQLTSELDKIFAHLHKKKPIPELNHLLVAQFNLQDKFIELIDREIALTKKGKVGYLVIKINNLEDKVMVDKLYEASQAGVKIFLIVRGICTLVPGIEGMSENINVIRLVDRFLEHARIFIFHNDGNEEIYMGSADWMKRNLYRRIEVVFPIYDPEVKLEVRKLIDLQLKDNTKARLLDENHNNNHRLSKHGKKVRAQIDFYNWLNNRYS